MTREFLTRQEIIDHRLKEAGWDVVDRTQVIEEFFVSRKFGSLVAEEPTAFDTREFSDYVLLGKNGKPLAVVEAKRSSKDAELGREQAKQYCVNIQTEQRGELPFCFYTNGHEIFFWNLGDAPPQRVHGFPTRQDLERLLFIRKHKKALVDELINTDIAGRDYQIQAIRTVMEGIAKSRRQFLLVMATGTGKTRTCIALIDALMRAGYADVKAINVKLEGELTSFCQSLFTDVIHLGAITSHIGEIDAHYIEFVKANKAGKCPYCGYNDIKGEHHSRREAYDHFLPKGIYPFNSVSFRNLAPMCHECNSSYKLKLDPVRHIDPISRKNTGTRRRAFYSYSANSPAISVNVIHRTDDVTNLTPDNIDLQLDSPGCNQEVESWADVFGIEERYKAKYCAENDGKAWLQHVIEESENGEVSADQLMALVNRAADRVPYDSANFLKRAFLNACKASGVLR